MDKLEAIIYIRKKLGLSQTDFADRMGMKQNNVSAYESGAHPIGWNKIFKMLRILRFKVSIRVEVDGEVIELNPNSAEGK